MTTTEVAFARSTWRKSREFSTALHDLAQRMPIDYYDRIDELRELRREALLGEMPYVEAQAEMWLEEHPAEAASIAANCRRSQATVEMLLGTSVMNGTSPAFGFSPETYIMAPSLRVYELFMWYDESERWLQN